MVGGGLGVVESASCPNFGCFIEKIDQEFRLFLSQKNESEIILTILPILRIKVSNLFRSNSFLLATSHTCFCSNCQPC